MHYQINFEKRGAYEDHHIRQAYQSEDNLFLIENQMHNCLLYTSSVQGVGIATILSQFISAVLITFCLMRTNECYRLKWSKVRFHKMLLIRIIQIGVPAGLQSVMYNIANIIIPVSYTHLQQARCRQRKLLVQRMRHRQ